MNAEQQRLRDDLDFLKRVLRKLLINFTWWQAADEIARRLTRLFLRGPDGRRAVFGDCPKLQDDPRFRDYLPFHEDFHGDTGQGLGASHQAGWTGLIALPLDPRELALAGRTSP